MTPPVIAIVTVVTRVMNSEGISTGTCLVARSRTAQNTTEVSASSENWLKPSRPGRTTIRTPTKPALIASQRRQPTGSPKISAAPNVMASGSAWKIAAVLASGRCTIAAMNEMVPPTSPITRSAIGFIISVRSGRNAFRCHASVAISAIANTPRTSMISPKFISDDTALVIASFSVKPAMATAMNRLPRIFGDRAKSAFRGS